MSDLLINFILPCNTIASFNQEFNYQILVRSAEILIIALVTEFILIFLSKYLYVKVPHDKRMVLRYGTICSNAGFIGMTVVGGFYGAEGILYSSMALLPIRIFMWSAGLSLFTVTDKNKMIKTIFTHPCIIAIFIGLFIMLSKIKLPAFLSSTIESISNCNTAISMIVVGSILAEINPKTVFNKVVLYYSAIRLIMIPIALIIVLKFINIDPLVIGVIVLLFGMPAGSTTAILASKYNGDAGFASKCVFVSTLLSMVTIPIIGIFI